MKKWLIAAVLLCICLAGCSDKVTPTGTFGTFTPPPTDIHGHPIPTHPNHSRPQATPAPSTTAPLGPAEFLLYLPNETGDGFVTQRSTMNNLDHHGILLLMMVNGAVNEGVTANSCKRDGKQLRLDMNQAFLDQLKAADASGEKMLIGSIVNTFLSAYQCETVLLTANGETITTANATYDSPLRFME